MKPTPKFHKPLFAEIADGTYDVQRHPETGIRSSIPFSKALSTWSPQIFVLSPEVATAAQGLAEDFLRVSPRGAAELHLPYPSVAIEFELSDKIRQMREAQNQRIFTASGAIENPHAAAKYDLSTIGVVARALGDGAILFQSYWRYADSGIVEVAPVAMVLNPQPAVAAKLTPIQIRHPQHPEHPIDMFAMPSPAWAPLLADPVASRALTAGYQDPDTLHRMVQESCEELPTAIYAALMLINCKSGVSATSIPARVAPSGYGKKLKRKHSSPAYTVLSLTEIENVAPTGYTSMRLDITAHYVRGHFKIRKGGVYWWNSFVRGSGAPRKRTAYAVTE